jgi:hypothetical protein
LAPALRKPPDPTLDRCAGLQLRMEASKNCYYRLVNDAVVRALIFMALKVPSHILILLLFHIGQVDYFA